MKKVLIGFIIISIMIILIIMFSPKEDDKKEINFKSIKMSEAQELFLKKSNYIILDVRTKEEYKDGHIPNSINIPNETINDNSISALPDKEQTIYVYCRSGNRSKQASLKLVKLGYSNVIEFGGIIDWEGEIEK